jgi:hypothetical protein
MIFLLIEKTFFRFAKNIPHNKNYVNFLCNLLTNNNNFPLSKRQKRQSFTGLDTGFRRYDREREKIKNPGQGSDRGFCVQRWLRIVFHDKRDRV